MSAAAEPLDDFSILRSKIEKHWGYRELRPLQEESMRAVLQGRDSLTVMPTGGGKSLCYQAPALVLGEAGQSTTVVVSPLISLMKDQVDSLRENGIPAAAFNSSQTAEERRAAGSDLLMRTLRLLFVSPERLMMPQFQQYLQQFNVHRFAIDEAHCVSHWGHDFRPEYRQLGRLREIFPKASIHAFTATATEHVRRDICDQLELSDPLVLVGNFDRPNLTYRVQARRELMKQVFDVLDRHKREPGIIYCIRRREVDELAEVLKDKGYNAHPYHAGMSASERTEAQRKFSDEECDIIVATVAFGMGIDRSNVRFVLHTGMPKSIEHYQQEAGRAGRDGLEAECVLLYSGQDTLTWKSIIEKSADEAVGEGTRIDPAFVPSALRHLEDIDRYSRGAVCRHKALVEYFGQAYQGPADSGEIPATEPFAGDKAQKQKTPKTATSCAACDLCLGDTEMVPDAITVAQKILSAIYRTGQRFGIGHVIAVLRGQNTDRIRQLHHDELPTYGVMRDTDERAVRDFIYQLIGQGVLVQEIHESASGQQFPIVKLNNASLEVLRKQREIRLVQPVIRKKSGKSRAAEISWEGVDQDLFEALRVFRRDIAHERSVPPYVVFSDNTLRELARIRPSTMDRLRLVYGIGETKLADLGPRVLPVLKAHCQTRGLSMDNTTPPAVRSAGTAQPKAPSARVNPQRDQAFELFRSGATIDEVSQQTGRSRMTVVEYLCEFIVANRPAEVTSWIPKSTYQQIVTVARQVGTGRLKPIYLALNEQYDYDHIRIVLAHMETR